MLIFGQKSKYPENGRPVMGVIRLLAEANRSEFSTGRNAGRAKWSAYGVFEDAPPGQRGTDNTVTVSTKFDVDLAEQLIPFQKGTRLFVAGTWQKDEYRTERNGKDTYFIKAELVVAQPNYAELLVAESADNAAEYDKEAGNGDEDPGF